MKSYRKMRAGIKLLAKLEPVATFLKDNCPDCKGPVVLWFDHAAKHKPYYPTHEACLDKGCAWQRPFADIEAEARKGTP